MSPALDQTDRRFMPVGRNVVRLFAPGLVAVAVLTVAASVPAGAHDPRIKKPGAPTGVTAIAVSGGAAVSWTAPVSDGGSPITGYTVTASHSQQTCTTTGATMCTVTGLTDGHRHEIKVRASNAKGKGHASRGVQVTPVPSVSFASDAELFSGTIAVPVTLNQSSSRTVQVAFATSNGPNGGTYDTYFIGDADAFSPSAGTVTFAPGQTTAAISFTVDIPNPGGCPVPIPASDCFPDLTVTLYSPVNALLGAVTSTNVGYDGS
jgi:Fibronectin type III domain